MNESPLSKRELEILKLVATGAGNKEISQQLHISINTVKVHLRNIFTKLEIASRTEAAMWAVQNGLVDVGGEETASEKVEKDNVQDHNQAHHWYSTIPRWLWGWVIVGGVILLILSEFGGSLLWKPVPQTLTQPSDAISVAEFEESRWKRMADMPTGRAGLAAAAFDNHIYAIAGEGVDGPVAVNERYDPQTDTWQILTPKLVSVQDVHAGVVSGRIYIPGGQLADGSVTNIMEVYDPRSDTWSLGEPLPSALSGYAMATFEGKLYVFGGWDGEQVLDLVYVYDPDANSWEIEMQMPTARAFAGAAEVGGKIYVIGGWDGNDALGVNEVYDTLPSINNPWIVLENLPAQSRFIVISVLNDLFLFADDSNKIFKVSIRESTLGEYHLNGLNICNHYPNNVRLENRNYFLGGKCNNIPQPYNNSIQLVYTVTFPLIIEAD
jgi:DNA-binding CsgD family transcriptional regulator